MDDHTENPLVWFMNDHSVHCLGDGCSRKETCLRFTNLPNAKAWTPVNSSMCRNSPNFPSWISNKEASV